MIFVAAHGSCGANLLLWLRKWRIEKLQYILIYIGLWGVYWEITGSNHRATAVADKYDIVAYCTGGVLYWALNTIIASAQKHDVS